MNSLPTRCFHVCRIPYVPIVTCGNLNQRRYKYKPKWAMQLKASSNCQRALDHFDAFYKPVYGELWPSIRLSLLSLPKHCALVNKYSDISKVNDRLQRLEAYDVIELVRSSNPTIYNTDENANTDNSEANFSSTSIENRSLNTYLDSSDDESGIVRGRKIGPSDLSYVLDRDNIELYDEDLHKDNLDVFVPPEMVVSEKDKRLEEEIQVSSFQPGEVDIETVTMEPIDLSTDLSAFIFPHTDVSRFPQPKAFNQASGYYLMDAASLLPVVALDVRPSDHVLDLCAAPGGKSVAVLQTLDLQNGGILYCNDSSSGRIARLKNVLKSYIPSSIAKDIRVSQMDGLSFNQPLFNKVLVDVPCNTDRHVVTDDDNNLFKPNRSHERRQMMRLQRDLLISGIQSCRVGGSIVYSTCTLASAQNDGVIQAAVETLRETSQIDVVVEDLSPLTQAFESCFKFFDRCRYGQLALPCLTQNFGPLYFAKLKRIR